MIKALLFDIDDTILDFHACSKKAISIAARKLNVTLPEDFFSIFLPLNQELWHKVELGELSVDELFQIRFNYIFGKCNVSYDGKAFEEEFKNALTEAAEPMPGALEVLDTLSKKYKLYAVSNSRLHQQVNRLKLAGFYEYFTKLYVSGELLVSKPSKEFFDLVLKDIGCAKDECIVIGDSLSSDILGAYNSNISSIWLNRNHKINKDSIPTREIEELIDLLKII